MTLVCFLGGRCRLPVVPPFDSGRPWSRRVWSVELCGFTGCRAKSSCLSFAFLSHSCLLSNFLLSRSAFLSSASLSASSSKSSRSLLLASFSLANTSCHCSRGAQRIVFWYSRTSFFLFFPSTFFVPPRSFFVRMAAQHRSVEDRYSTERAPADANAPSSFSPQADFSIRIGRKLPTPTRARTVTREKKKFKVGAPEANTRLKPRWRFFQDGGIRLMRQDEKSKRGMQKG